jgi:hypothetical protein
VSYATGRAATIQPEIDCNCGATPCVQRFFLTPQFVRIPPFTRGIRCLSPCQGSDFCRRECALRVCAWGCASRTPFQLEVEIAMMEQVGETTPAHGTNGLDLDEAEMFLQPMSLRDAHADEAGQQAIDIVPERLIHAERFRIDG